MPITSSLTLEEIRSCFDKLSNLPDNMMVDNEHAAIYLGISIKSLARYRMNGSGPSYHQYPLEGSKARNQKVYYKMGDLRDWRESHKVKSTIEAATKRGLCFTTVNDIERVEPFWIQDLYIIDHATYISKELFTEHLLNEKHDIIWLSWIDVFSGKYKISRNLDYPTNLYIDFLESLLNKARLLVDTNKLD